MAQDVTGQAIGQYQHPSSGAWNSHYSRSDPILLGLFHSACLKLVSKYAGPQAGNIFIEREI
ncbi:MAG: hypothetical protein ACC645_21385, partial [Pirellulales bacterium]